MVARLLLEMEINTSKLELFLGVMGMCIKSEISLFFFSIFLIAVLFYIISVLLDVQIEDTLGSMHV